MYVDYLVSVNILALKGGLGAGIFNIGTGIETTLTQTFNYLKGVVDSFVSEKYASAKQGEQRRSYFDCSRAESILHWGTETSLVDGLKETYDYLENVLTMK